MEDPVFLNCSKTELTGRFQRVAVQHDLVNGTIVVMEPGQGPNGAIDHWAVEAGGCALDDAISKSLYILFECR